MNAYLENRNKRLIQWISGPCFSFPNTYKRLWAYGRYFKWALSQSLKTMYGYIEHTEPMAGLRWAIGPSCPGASVTIQEVSGSGTMLFSAMAQIYSRAATPYVPAQNHQENARCSDDVVLPGHDYAEGIHCCGPSLVRSVVYKRVPDYGVVRAILPD